MLPSLPSLFLPLPPPGGERVTSVTSVCRLGDIGGRNTGRPFLDGDNGDASYLRHRRVLVPRGM
ncbi:hypothetical protein [Bacteroides fragilis]|uniref:hypothetical protein n=1 Tax=Bacteroides fragilis TaxID=817 RepID=UPI0038543C93